MRKRIRKLVVESGKVQRFKLKTSADIKPTSDVLKNNFSTV